MTQLLRVHQWIHIQLDIQTYNYTCQQNTKIIRNIGLTFMVKKSIPSRGMRGAAAEYMKTIINTVILKAKW